jgi:hypothetical protein
MDVCKVCQTIDIRDLLESFRNSEQVSDLQRGQTMNWDSYYTSAANYQPHQASLAALRDAGESGCRLCSMIWARHCSERAEYHGGSGTDDDCMCKRFCGPVRFIAYQRFYSSFVKLVALAVSETGEQGGADARPLAELEIATAKGM